MKLMQKGKKYDLVTIVECELPEGAKIKIGKVGRILKRMYLLYEDKEFPMISLAKISKMI